MEIDGVAIHTFDVTIWIGTGKTYPSNNTPIEVLWASPREIYNLIQANNIGCHIITATHDLLHKLELIGKDLDDHSLDTVKMFHRDAAQAGYEL